MPTEVLNQLRVLRENIAETLRNDPRYLTLAALDKTIAEISSVLGAAGITPPLAPAAAAPLHFESPAANAAPDSVAASNPATAAPATGGIAAASPQYAASTPASAPAVVPVKKKKSLVTPLVAAAAGLAAVGVAAEVASLASGGKMGKAAPKADAPEGDGKTEDGEADGEPAPGTEPFEAAGEDAAEHDNEAEGETKATVADGIIPEGKAGGYVPMKAKAGAPQYQPAISVKFGKLPNKVDLRSLMTPIEDQGETSSCVANAVAGAYEYWIKKASKQDQNISRLFVYYNARWRDGSQDKDDGSVIQLAMEGLQKFGACNEKVWPFDTHLVTKKPGAEAYQDAAPFKVQDMAQVPLKLESWKQALAEGKPIVFGCLLFDSFDECSKKGGVVPMPAPEDVGRKTHSGHSMCAVGYSDSEKVFIVRNSWGADWGDKGYCYMPYSYLMNSKFNDGDCWVFVPKVPAQPPREVWSDDTKPVTNDGNGVDFPIETYTVEQYEALSVDLFERIRKPFNTFVREDFSEYVSFASQSLWSRMESFDFRTFLASTAAIAGVSTALSEFTSEFSSSESVSASSDETSDEEQDADEEQDSDEDSDEEQDEDAESDDDQDEDDESDNEESDDDESDEKSDDDQDSDEESDDDESDDESEDDESSDEDDGGEESDDESEDGDDSEDDGDEDSDEDDDNEDDSDEEDGGGDEEGDDGGDEGGGDEGDDD